MRNLFSAVVNWIAAFFASSSGAPHPIVSTDMPGPEGDDLPGDPPIHRRG